MMQSQVVQDVGSLIDKLAAKLAVPAAQLWEILTRQAKVAGLTSLLWAAAWFVLAIVLAKQWERAKRSDAQFEALRKEGKAYGEPPSTSLFVVIGTILLTGIGLFWLTAAIQRLVNPQFYALKYVLDALK